MSTRGRAIVEVVWTGLFAVVFTAVVSGIWAGLLLTNLRVSPAIPWSVLAMALVLWAAWSLLGGRWGSPRAKAALRKRLRARKLPAPVFAWAVAAGLLWVIALAGLWIVLRRLIAFQTNPLPDFSRCPPWTVLAALLMASISGGLSEEAAFRGYFQGALQRAGLGWSAVAVQALVMAPEHASTQGFVWPTIGFYLLVDGMLGALAYLTGSIRPGVVVHATGLYIFFSFIWPNDSSRAPVSVTGLDAWFWGHVLQVIVFAALSLAAFARLRRAVRGGEPPFRRSAPAPYHRRPAGVRNGPARR
jgi:membrane protease YdiL (CAAX protease family)